MKGGFTLVDMDRLRQAMDDSGMTMKSIAEKSGIVRETLYNRLKKAGDFRVSEIEGLTKTLGLSKKERDAIFFNQ
jgi:DNA-binding phage protein